MLKGLALGILGTLLVIALVGFIVTNFGFVDARADIGPTWYAPSLAHAMDASTARHAPKLTNPLQPRPEVLNAGKTAYSASCAICHGSAEKPQTDIEGLNPPAPEFFAGDPANMPENQNFYIIKHGIRMTGMPAWEKKMSDEDIWKIVTYLSHSQQAKGHEGD